MPAPITLAQGQVITSFVPFDERDGGKIRPCMVLGWRHFSDKRDIRILLVPISTLGGGAAPTAEDLLLDDEEGVDLNAGSYLRTLHFGTVSLAAMTPTRLIGRLSPGMIAAALTGVEKLAIRSGTEPSVHVKTKA